LSVTCDRSVVFYRILYQSCCVQPIFRAFIWSQLPPKFDVYTLLCCRLLFMYQG